MQATSNSLTRQQTI